MITCVKQYLTYVKYFFTFTNVIRSIRSRALKRFWEESDSSGLRPDWVGRVARILDVLNQAVRPSDMNVPSFGFHPLKGNLRGRYAVTVSRNWRITFAWLGEDAIDVSLEDYHG